MSLRWAVLVLIVWAGCTKRTPTSAEATRAAASAAEKQTPPQGSAALEAWIKTGTYKMWACEKAVSRPRPHGAHGRTRVCSNALMSGHREGPFPVGAAAVKELYGHGDDITGYAVSRRVKPGPGGDAWYWYERTGPNVYEDGVGASGCADCHALAQQRGGLDFVYVQVR
jgi:hypothetical protein